MIGWQGENLDCSRHPEARSARHPHAGGQINPKDCPFAPDTDGYKFGWATAVIDGDTVVGSAAVPEPVVLMFLCIFFSCFMHVLLEHFGMNLHPMG